MRVQFVCLGNICRSPTAHAVLRAKVQGLGWQVNSAGTGGWHIGHPPDPRAVAEAEARGYPMADLRAQQFTTADFDWFDLILAMDRSNLRDISGASAQAQRGQCRAVSGAHAGAAA